MKRAFQIVLAIVIVILAVVLANSIMSPVRFQRTVAERERDIIVRLQDIRAAQQAFRDVHNVYTASFDALIDFVLSDSLILERTVGSSDDSLAVAKGLVYTETFRVPVIDTIFGRRLTPDDVEQLRTIPHSDGKEFFLEAGSVETESNTVVPVFEARAPFNFYLADLNRQYVDNLIDQQMRTFKKYPGLKVGSMQAATNDAGNWE